MSYVDNDVAEGRRCAAVITDLAAKLDEFVEGEACELCHMLDTLASNLKVLATDLLDATEAYAESEGSSEKKGG